MRLHLSVVAALTLLAAAPTALRAAPPVPHWRTLETDHFRVHYYDEEVHLAYRAAGIAERAFAMLTRRLNWVPAGRIDITLIDQTDSANGFANSLPNNYIFGFSVPPDSLSTLNDFDDWLTVLITHELTHVVHLDITLGFSRIINFITGKKLAPNQIQPNWLIEGLAVVQESDGGTGGRLRNNLFDMFLRAPVLEGTFHDLDRVSNGPRAFPQGTAAYLYGSAFLKYIEDRFGPDKVTEMTHRYGSHLIPFSINRTARDTFGLRFDELWDAWKGVLANGYGLQAAEAARRAATPVRRVTFLGDGSGGGPAPRFFPDGTVLYQSASSFHRPTLMRLDPATLRSTVVAELSGIGVAAPTPDGRALIVQQSTFQSMRHRISGSSHADWDDLYRYDLDARELVRLTEAARAHEPAVSPDGSRIAFARGGVGEIDSAVMPATGGPARILAHHDGDIVYTPSFSPDGRRIAYSRWKEGGYRDIHIYDLVTDRDQALWVDRALDMDPRFSPDGQTLYFASDRTGIFNLYAWDFAPRRLWQVTSVSTGALQPAISPDGRQLAFTGFGGQGYDLYLAEVDRALWLPALPYVNDRDDAHGPGPVDPEEVKAAARRERSSADSGGVPRAPTPTPRQDPGTPRAPPTEASAAPVAAAPATAALTGTSTAGAGSRSATAGGDDAVPGSPAGGPPVPAVVHRITDYQPWKYMYPRVWDLVLSSNALGLGPDLGIAVNVGDAVGNHGLSLRADVPVFDGDTSARIDYTYAGLWPAVSLSASRGAYTAGGLIRDEGNYAFREHSRSVGTSVSLPVLRRPDAWGDLWGGYFWRDYHPADPIAPADPGQGITRAPEKGPQAGMYLGFYYSNAQSWNYSVGGQQGRRLSFSLGVDDYALGSRYRTVQLGWAWVEYLTPPWSRLQSFAFTYSGGVGIGDKRNFFYLGGFYEQDLLRSFFLNLRQCCTYLRGYAAGSIGGDQYHLASGEYRVPLLWFERGYQTFPVYFRRLTGAAFTDVGDAFYGDVHPSSLRVGVGGELRLEFKVGYYLESLLQIGVAKGLSRDGILDTYIASSFPF